MTKRKAKSLGNLAAVQPPLLKTSRRKHPGDEETKIADVQANLQDIAAGASLIKESTVTSAVEQQQMKHESLVTDREPAEVEATDAAVTETATMIEVGPQTTFKNVNVDSQAEGSMAPVSEFRVVAEACGPVPHPCSDPPQVTQTPPNQENPLAAFEDQGGTKENSQCDMENDLESNKGDSSCDSTAAVKEVTKGMQICLRRIEMCCQAQEGRSAFPQTETEMSQAPGPSSGFIQTEGDAEQKDAEELLQLHVKDGNDENQAEVHGAVVTSDGDSGVADQAQEEHSCENKDRVVPQDCGVTRSDRAAVQEDQERQHLDQGTASNVSEEPAQQIEDVDQRPATCLDSISLKNRAAENCDITVVMPQLASSDTSAADDNGKHSAWASASSAETCPAVPPRGPERKDTLGVDDPGTRPKSNTGAGQIKSSTDPFGLGYSDYVSDSQLNTIPLTEEEIVKGENDLGSPDCPDGTDLICGLIKELSWLNRRVMANHRELENMRRSHKSLRNSTR